MNKYLAPSALFFVLFYPGLSLAGDDVMSSQLKNIVVSHIAATSKESESIDDLMKTMHTDSPVSMQIKTQMEQVFPVFDLNMALDEFSLVGLDGDYAMARVKQKIEKVSGPASLKSHINEQVYVFKQEQGEWKIWQAAMLDMDFL